nr:MAG TPA: hypothetical protein [Ackermannviridae sp.]
MGRRCSKLLPTSVFKQSYWLFPVIILKIGWEVVLDCRIKGRYFPCPRDSPRI